MENIVHRFTKDSKLMVISFTLQLSIILGYVSRLSLVFSQIKSPEVGRQGSCLP
jgi:hypothetical protein